MLFYEFTVGLSVHVQCMTLVFMSWMFCVCYFYSPTMYVIACELSSLMVTCVNKLLRNVG